MSACPAPGEQLKVLILAERQPVYEPVDVVALLNHDLDTKEVDAIYAAHIVQSINRRFLLWMSTLEEATGLLEQSAEASDRARAAHDHFRTATDLANTIVSNLNDAQDALQFDW